MPEALLENQLMIPVEPSLVFLGSNMQPIHQGIYPYFLPPPPLVLTLSLLGISFAVLLYLRLPLRASQFTVRVHPSSFLHHIAVYVNRQGQPVLATNHERTVWRLYAHRRQTCVSITGI